MKHQVWIRKTNTSEPPFKLPKVVRDGVETGELILPRDESGGNLSTGQVAPGIEVA